MNRRDSLTALAALGASLTGLRADAQATKPTATTKVIGILSPNPPQPSDRVRPVFERFATLGWVPGKNVAFERPLGQEDQLEEMVVSLVRKPVDVIWAIGPEAAVTAARATREIPIVFWGVALPLELGVIDSLARPGKNATGVAFFTGPELYSKQLELLKIIAPSAQRLAWISTPSAPARSRAKWSICRTASWTMPHARWDSTFADMSCRRRRTSMARSRASPLRERRRSACRVPR